MKKYLWLTTILIISIIPLTGCALVGEEEAEIEEPINVAEWPTPVPTAEKAAPTPFTKVTLPPTATPSPRADTPTPQPTAAASQTGLSAASIDTILEQVGALGGLSPVAVAFTTRDTGVYQGPSAATELAESVKSAEMLAILGQNQNGNWLYVITITAARGWIPTDALRVTGSLAEAPVLPDDPIAAALAEVLGGELPAAEEPTVEAAPPQTSPEVIPAAAETTVDTALLPRYTLAEITEAVAIRKVELRRGPGENFGEVNTLTVDEKVMVRAVSPDRGWAVVEAPFSKIGWAPLDSLTVSGSLENAPAVLTAWVDSNELDVRDGPGIYYDVVGKLGINEIVSVLGLDEGRSWALVETRAGGLGWIQLRLLTIAGSLADVAELDNDILAQVWQAETPGAPTGAVATAPAGRPLAQSQLVIQRSSGGDILVINPDGSGLRQLTTGIDPVLSPDGQTVAFTRWQGETGSVWLINIDGSNERQILGNIKQVKGPDWSPDGSQLMVNFQQGGRLQEKQECVDAAKAGRPPYNAYDIEFVMETDGDGDREAKLCWMLPADLYWQLRLINVADGSFTDYDGGTYAFRPAFDPARPWRVVSDGGRGLLAIDVNNSDYRQPLTDNLADSGPVFSPNGQFMAVFGGRTGSDQGYNIYRLNADGSGRLRLTETPLWVAVQPEAQKQWNNVAPAWASDGSKIAFLTDRTGRWEIWTMNPDGSNQQALFSDEVNDQLELEYNFVDERVISWR